MISSRCTEYLPMFVCVNLPLCHHPRIDTEVHTHTHTQRDTHTHTYPGLRAQGVCRLHARTHTHTRIAQNTYRRANCTCAKGRPRSHLLNTSQTPPAPFHCASFHVSLDHTPVSVCTCKCLFLSLHLSLSVFASASASGFLPLWAAFPGNFSCSYRPDFQVFVDC